MKLDSKGSDFDSDELFGGRPSRRPVMVLQTYRLLGATLAIIGVLGLAAIVTKLQRVQDLLAPTALPTFGWGWMVVPLSLTTIGVVVFDAANDRIARLREARF